MSNPTQTIGHEVIEAHMVRYAATLRACKATLMFHRGGRWDHEEWKQLTGQDEATTKSLCDFVRSALAEPPEGKA